MMVRCNKSYSILAAMPLILIALILIASTGVSAQQTTPSTSSTFFVDVPPGSWAYEAIYQLWLKGLLTGYPDNTFKGGQPLTRYEMALMIYKLLAYLEKLYQVQPNSQNLDAIVNEILSKSAISKEEIKLIRDLVDEFRNELIAFEKELKELKARVDALEQAQNTALILSTAALVVSAIALIVAFFI